MAVSYLSVFIMYKYPSQSYTFLMHNYEDAPQDRLINKTRGGKKLSRSLSVCVCVLKGNEAEEATCVQHCTYCFHHLFSLKTWFYWKRILISTNSCSGLCCLPYMRLFFCIHTFFFRTTKCRKLDKTWIFSYKRELRMQKEVCDFYVDFLHYWSNWYDLQLCYM